MPWASVRDNVRLPLKLAGRCKQRRPLRAVRRRAGEVGLADFANAFPRELSGGMKMRVSLARALVTDPRYSADGRAVRRARRDHALSAQQRPADAVAAACGKTVIFVTHSVFESVYLSQRVVVMTRTARPPPGRHPHRDRRTAHRGVSYLDRLCAIIAAGSRTRWRPLIPAQSVL